ncbi:hypothetical protein VNI00_018659 [Paramarasmius palmivorus]|uniref:DUF6570 domain-containing protein n=1 Tax=Paramarasmius palmivorus TaxID=297713 RepID=A0AAW0AUE1_9AGAR
MSSQKEDTEEDTTGQHQNDESTLQRGLKGHVITYPQSPSDIVAELPPPIEEMCTYICAVFVGPRPPKKKWLLEKASPLYVRKEKVQKALHWLKTNNPLYKDLKINEANLQALPQNDILPVHIQHLLPKDAGEELTSRYDDDESAAFPDPSSLRPVPEREIPFEKVVIADANGAASAANLRRAALKHFEKGGAWIQVPHDPSPVVEFDDPELFPLIYPTLFPYGLGGCEDSRRISALSMKRHLKHFFNLADKRCEAYKTLVNERNIYAKLCERGSTLSKDPYNRHKKSTSTLVERLQITRTQGKCTSDE